MRPIYTTLTIGLAAAAAAAAAAFYYPWPTYELVSDRVDKPLFAELDAKQVRTVEIAHYDSDKNRVERLTLERRGDKWVLPQYANYSASNALRIAAVINNFVECVVHELRTDEQLDHLKYGVVDLDAPDGMRQTSAGLAWKVTLSDRSQRQLASLLIGQEVAGGQGSTKHFVRIPGEPQVYIVNFELAALSTTFRDWVDSNLLQIGTGEAGAGEQLLSSKINSYRIEPDKLASAEPPQPFYVAEFGSQDGRPVVSALQFAQGDALQATEPTEEQQQILLRGLNLLQNLVFVDAQPKSAAAVDVLKSATVPPSMQELESMQALGFRPTGAAGEPLHFQSTGGEIVVRMASGIRVTLYLGNIITPPRGDARLARMAIVLAHPDLENHPQPSPPSNEDGAPLSDEQQREHARQVEQWEAFVKQARLHAENFNQVHAPWYYALDEELVNLIRPELPRP